MNWSVFTMVLGIGAGTISAIGLIGFVGAVVEEHCGGGWAMLTVAALIVVGFAMVAGLAA